MNIAKSLCAFVGLAFSAGAGAISWDTGSPPTFNPTLNVSSIWCSQAVSGSSTCSTSAIAGANVIKMTAYSTSTALVSPNGNNSPVDTGTWTLAQIAMYSGGVGISNVKQNIGGPGGSEGTASPQHAMDNRGVDDILVIDFNPNNVAGFDIWDVSSFTLGYTCAMAANTDPNASSLACNSPNNVNPDAWVGGTNNTVNFGSTQFNGSNVANINITTGVAGQTFTPLVLSPDGTIATGARNNSTTTDNVFGRYLVIAPSLLGYTDAFKVSGISADVVPPPPGGHSVPAPGSAPLIALALLAMTLMIRRRKAAPIRIR